MKTISESMTTCDMLSGLATMAQRSGDVSWWHMKDGTSVFAYPADGALIVGVGRAREHDLHVPPDLMLQRRSENPARYGPWLPALFADGGRFVLRRLSGTEEADATAVRRIDLGIAQELLAP